MGFGGGTGDEDVVEINKNEGKILEDVVHEALECLGGISEAKRHGKVFEKAERGDHRRFGNVGGVNGNLVVTFDEVQLGKKFGVV